MEEGRSLQNNPRARGPAAGEGEARKLVFLVFRYPGFAPVPGRGANFETESRRAKLVTLTLVDGGMDTTVDAGGFFSWRRRARALLPLHRRSTRLSHLLL